MTVLLIKIIIDSVANSIGLLTVGNDDNSNYVFNEVIIIIEVDLRNKWKICFFMEILNYKIDSPISAKLPKSYTNCVYLNVTKK